MTRAAAPHDDLRPPPSAAAVFRSDGDRLLFLARCLSFDRSATATAALQRLVRSPELPWPEILAFANHELLTPALWVRLRDKGLADALPREVAAYLRRSHAVNLVRNDRIRRELEQVIGRLNGEGIEPVLLKGGVDLFVHRYADPGARVLRDVDIFIPKPDLERAVGALTALGYGVVPRDAGRFVTYYAELTRPGAMVPVDLQWYISGQRDVLSPEEAWRDAVPIAAADGLRCRALSPDHQIVHNVLHSELQDRGGDVGFVWLRQLLDLAALCQHHGDAVSWPRVRDHFAERGLARVLPRRLYMAHRLVGLPMPAEIRPTAACQLHYHRCLTQLRWRWLMAVGRLWATMTSPFDARLLDVVYGSGVNPWRTGISRIRHGVRLLGHYRGNLRGVVQRRRMKFD